MNTRFADTAFYVALLNKHDALHTRSLGFAPSRTTPIVTTEFVLIEVANFFTGPSRRGAFIRLRIHLGSDPNTRILPASTELYQRGCDLFAARPDKEWSLTDCISFVVMEEMKLTEALTADHHFTQAGFVALLA